MNWMICQIEGEYERIKKTQFPGEKDRKRKTYVVNEKETISDYQERRDM